MLEFGYNVDWRKIALGVIVETLASEAYNKLSSERGSIG